ncbi:hypothetical protein HYV70_05840 [Candidatus Uhrbacteria bacterium]|nr:hypothetical protein [Candidatus Uhrbacteria bacterium]
MSCTLSPFNREVVAVLREQGVLCDYQARGRNGQIVVACSDGDQMKDLLLHKWEQAIRRGKKFRPHMLCFHGGAMNIDVHCKLYPGLGQIVLDHIRQAEGPNLKGITSVNLSIHTPCGAAELNEMTLIHQMWHQYRASLLVAQIDLTNTIIPTLHVDYGEDDTELVLRANSLPYKDSATAIQRLADETGVKVLIPIPETHRRRTYLVNLNRFIEFWKTSGNALWGHLFEIDPLTL